MLKENMVRGKKYHWKYGDSRPLVYLGYNRSGNGYWHQFAEVDRPNEV